MKLMRCRDVGFNCDTTFNGDTEDDIISNARIHGIKEHNMKEEDITPEFKEKIRKLITSAL